MEIVDVEIIDRKTVVVEDRLRRDMGNIDELANSIKEFGVIQPIVLVRDFTGCSDRTSFPRLVAGGRRFAALSRLGINQLLHGKHFIWREDLYDTTPESKLRLRAVELEENLRRKDLTWQEQVTGKKELLEYMKKIHGPSSGGRPSSQQMASKSTGFSMRKLSAMLGESIFKTSKDIQIATAISVSPQLRGSDTKESAYRKLTLAATVSDMVDVAKVKDAAAQVASTLSGQTTISEWTLHEGSAGDVLPLIPADSVDLIHVDLPYGADIETIGNLDKSLTGFADSRKKLLAELPTMLAESYRILSDDRFIVLWFGFNNYCDLCACLSQTGFSYDPVPIIWNKRTHSTQNPDKKYARTYEQALIAWKGSPTFIRIAQTNLIDNVSPVSPLKKLHVAEKPLGVIEKFIFDCTISGQTVLDFCAGSGSTGEAAVRAGRKAILVEENQQACMTIRARMGAL